MIFEVFADIWCPFAHVGLRAVAERRRQAGREDVTFLVRAWPLEVVNGAPMDPEKAAHHAADLRAQVAPDLFARLDLDHFPVSTLEALALTASAYRQGPGVGERMAFALRDAVFEQGLDIGDQSVLGSIASAAGVELPSAADREQVHADHADGVRRGVIGSPHFFCGDDSLFCPALSISRSDEGHLVVQQDVERLDAFLNACFDRIPIPPSPGA